MADLSTPKEITQHHIHAAVVNCPTCRQETTPLQDGRCGFCDLRLLEWLPGIGWIYHPHAAEDPEADWGACEECGDASPTRFCSTSCKNRADYRARKARRAVSA